MTAQEVADLNRRAAALRDALGAAQADHPKA
jgi:hypothetical protein